jgi:hypothetical protein
MKEQSHECSNGSGAELTKGIATFFEVMKKTHPNAYELQEEFRSMPISERVLALPYYPIMFLLAGYFGEGDELRIPISKNDDCSHSKSSSVQGNVCESFSMPPTR